jgi:hypothetical protein
VTAIPKLIARDCLLIYASKSLGDMLLVVGMLLAVDIFSQVWNLHWYT